MKRRRKAVGIMEHIMKAVLVGVLTVIIKIMSEEQDNK